MIIRDNNLFTVALSQSSAVHMIFNKLPGGSGWTANVHSELMLDLCRIGGNNDGGGTRGVTENWCKDNGENEYWYEEQIYSALYECVWV